MIYVFKCEECGEQLEREFPMGEAPQFIRSDCDRNGKMKVRANRVFVPLMHQWRDGRKGVRDRVDEARAIREDPNKEVTVTHF